MFGYIGSLLFYYPISNKEEKQTSYGNNDKLWWGVGLKE